MRIGFRLRRALDGSVIFACVTFACARETPPVAPTGGQPVRPEPTVSEPSAIAPSLEDPPAGIGNEGRALAERYAASAAAGRFTGAASYYSDKLAGRSTASGEPYDPRAFTAAHRSLPFGTVVRVLRSEPPGVVYVRINDRGPFVRGRVLDLSRAAAEALQMVRAGVIPVRAEVVEYGPPPKKKQRRRRKRR